MIAVLKGEMRQENELGTNRDKKKKKRGGRSSRRNLKVNNNLDPAIKLLLKRFVPDRQLQLVQLIAFR